MMCVWLYVYVCVFCMGGGCLFCDALLLEPFLMELVELICTLWAYFTCLNHFLNDFIVFIDLENVGVVTSFARFGHDFTKLCLKNGFCSKVMC